MIKKLLALLFLCSACGAPTEELDGVADRQEGEPALGTAEQDLLLQTAYGVQRGPAGGPQLRCVSGAASDCMVPAKKTIEVAIDLDAVTSSTDRSSISAAFNSALQTAKDGDDGFTWQTFAQRGFPPDGKNACMLRVQNFFTPVTTAANDMRKYVGGYSYGVVTDFGSRSTFRTLTARSEWNGLKAHRGVTGTCTTSPSNACFITAKKMVLAFLAACGGVGFSSNASADGRGNDLEANSVISTLAGDGDLCRMKQYEPDTGSGIVPDFDDCAL